MNLATVETAKGARMFRNPAGSERAVFNLVVAPVKAAVRNPMRAASCSSCGLQGVCLPCGQNSEKLGGSTTAGMGTMRSRSRTAKCA